MPAQGYILLSTRDAKAEWEGFCITSPRVLGSVRRNVKYHVAVIILSEVT